MLDKQATHSYAQEYIVWEHTHPQPWFKKLVCGGCRGAEVFFWTLMEFLLLCLLVLNMS